MNLANALKIYFYRSWFETVAFANRDLCSDAKILMLDFRNLDRDGVFGRIEIAESSGIPLIIIRVHSGR
jgi:hypothetical protein